MFTSMDAHKSWNARFADREALTAVNHGYRRGLINRNSAYAHRVIWKMMTGVDAEELDHIDGDRTNNAWHNLRFGARENQRNCQLRHDNTSGCVGVVKRGDRWIAQIGVNGTTKHIGIYATRQEAVHARKQAETGFGFHPNHGREAATEDSNPAA